MAEIENPKHKRDGFWIQGTVRDASYKIDEEAISEKMKELQQAEANKIPLWQASREKLDQYFTKAFKLNDNHLLKKYPTFLPQLLDILYTTRKAFTASESDP